MHLIPNHPLTKRWYSFFPRSTSLVSRLTTGSAVSYIELLLHALVIAYAFLYYESLDCYAIFVNWITVTFSIVESQKLRSSVFRKEPFLKPGDILWSASAEIPGHFGKGNYSPYLFITYHIHGYASRLTLQSARPRTGLRKVTSLGLQVDRVEAEHLLVS